MAGDDGLVPTSEPPDLSTSDHGPALRAWLAAHPEDGPAALDQASLRVSTEVLVSTDEILCMRIDAVWRCTIDPWVRVSGPSFEAGIPVRDANEVVVPVEVSSCDGGAEESACIHRLHLLRVAGTSLVDAGHLRLGAKYESIERDADYYEDAPPGVLQDGPAWGTHKGVIDEFRWSYNLERPLCLRLTSVTAEHTEYVRVHRHDRPTRERSGVQARRVRYAPAENELAAHPPLLEPFEAGHLVQEPVADLRGSWRLDAERWVRVSSCPPL